jgi:putative Ca2+/H+ antiporter (TMEM165/GDT1 family)
VLGETFGRSLTLPCRRSRHPPGTRGEEPRVTSIVVALTTFAVIFLAELPDKTLLASLVLGTRYRPVPVLIGIAAGFAGHVVLAVVAGGLLGLLPHRTLAIVTAVLFLAGAVLIVRGQRPAGEAAVAAEAAGSAEAAEPRRRSERFGPAAWTGFAVILVAEFGDLTQVVIANLEARYHDPVAVGAGAVAALWAVAAIAVFGGKALLRLVPVRLVTAAAAACMLALAGLSLAGAAG